MTRISTLVGLILLALLPVMAPAQDTALAFDGLKADTKAPVQVQADQLQVNQSDGSAVFSGNVVVTQSDLVLKAGSVTVIYSADKKGIAQLQASGGVTLQAGGNAVAANEAIYTVDTGDLVMSGDVLITQGPTSLSGQKLTLSLKTGLGQMEGRVTTTFTPGGN
jgi:lipopolysaccharide export system protein LptA